VDEENLSSHPIRALRGIDDAICHCKSAEEAQALRSVLADRFAICKGNEEAAN